MHDDGRPHQEEDQILALAKAFEAMVEAGDSKFFDHDDLEMLYRLSKEEGIHAPPGGASSFSLFG